MRTFWGSDLKLLIESIELNLVTKTDKAEIEILEELLQDAKEQFTSK